MIKTKKQMFIIIGVFALVVLLGSVSYAWFSYRAETGNSELVAGDIYMHMTEGNETLTLTNIFPETAEEARARDDNYITFEISGLNTSNKTIYYEILLNHSDDKPSPKSRYADSDLKFDLVELDDNGDEVTYVVDAASFDTLIDKRIWTDTIDASMQTEVSKKYKLRAWLAEDVIISDSEPDANYNTTEYPNKYATIKVKVNGDFQEKHVDYLYNIMKRQAVMDNINSDYVDNETPGINFGAISSNTNGKGVYMRAGTENDTYPIMYYRGAVDNNNVVFANKCWKAVRTTDTGGVKLIYNGENTGTIDEPNCNNTGTNTHISVDVNVTPQKTFAFNTNTNSPAYNGYMYGDVYTYNSGAATSGAYFGSSFSYDGTNYTLVDATTTKDDTHHYTCNLGAADGTCTTLRYYYYQNYYVNLTGGDGIEEALTKMQTNTNDSNAKDKIDTWYASNLTSYTNKLEDTIWCNDRSMGDGNNNGWIANGGDLSTYLYYGARERSNYAANTSTVKNQPSLACANKNDSFTVSNANGNHALTYPVAMITEDEAVLAGGLAGTQNTTFYLNNGSYYWSLSPVNFTNYDAFEFGVNNGGVGSYSVINTNGLRPAVSLKHGTQVVSGSGAASDPFVIE